MGKNTRAALIEREDQEAKLLARLRARTDDILRQAAAPAKPAIDELFAYRHLFARDPEALRARTKSRDRDRQVVELARYAFGRYPVCKALTSAWTRPAKGSTLDVDFRLWHICAATGGSLHKAHAKDHLTRAEVHQLLNCPHEISIEAALCHCVCRAAGASDGLAMRLARSKIREKPFDDYWRQALRFFSKHPPASVEEASDLADYLEHRRREGGANPLSGQSIESLRRRMVDWHHELRRAKILGQALWDGSPLPDESFERVDPGTGASVFWDFHQIKDARELAAEGTRMRHCVLSYKGSCISGSLSIWSLARREGFGDAAKKLTIELRSDGWIAQARGLANRAPRSDELWAIRAWARKRGLRLDS